MEAVAACPLCGEAQQVEVVSYPELAFVRCVGCGLVYKRAQRSSLGRGYERAYFEKGGARYLERFEHRVRKCRNQLLAALEFAPAAADVLDVGCSTGYVLEAARRLGLRAVGADTSEFAVRTCKERGYLAEVGQLTALPFADASFDVVTAKHTLEHSAQPLEALRELRRVLRPGGVLFLIVPDVEYWKETVLRRSGSYYRPDRLGWQHAVYYSDATLARACAAAGLAPVHAGKAIYRSRLARGPRAAWEGLRVAGVKVWNSTARALHLRREIQLIARRTPEPSAAEAPISGASRRSP